MTTLLLVLKYDSGVTEVVPFDGVIAGEIAAALSLIDSGESFWRGRCADYERETMFLRQEVKDRDAAMGYARELFRKELASV